MPLRVNPHGFFFSSTPTSPHLLLFSPSIPLFLPSLMRAKPRFARFLLFGQRLAIQQPRCALYDLPTSWLFQAFDDEKLNKRLDDRMKDENLITVVFNRSPGRTRQAIVARLLLIAAAGTGGDSPRGNAGACFRPISGVLSAV